MRFTGVRKERAPLRVGVGLVLLTLSAFFKPFPAAGQNSETAVEDQQTFPLHYTADGLALRVDLGLEGREVVFTKEPDFGGKQISRGVLQVNSDSAPYIGFVIDHSSRKLYLDRNHNLDLTDDEPILPIEKAQLDSSDILLFENVLIEVRHRYTPFTYVLDWTTYPFGMGYVTVRSGWVGTVLLDGAEYRLSIADNMNGRIDEEDTFLLRPEAEAETLPQQTPDKVQDKVPALTDGNVPGQWLPVPQVLATKGKSYLVSFAFQATEKAPVLLATFSDPHLEQGELKIEGQFVSGVVLRGDRLLALRFPEPVVRIPSGTYALDKVLLAEGLSSVEPGPQHASIAVVSDRPATLKLGGPLRPTITVLRLGRRLFLQYELLGIGGERYDPRSAKSPPGFSILREGNKIASGTFEYG